MIMYEEALRIKLTFNDSGLSLQELWNLNMVELSSLAKETNYDNELYIKNTGTPYKIGELRLNIIKHVLETKLFESQRKKWMPTSLESELEKEFRAVVDLV